MDRKISIASMMDWTASGDSAMQVSHLRDAEKHRSLSVASPVGAAQNYPLGELP
jgi:hypothetical protein